MPTQMSNPSLIDLGFLIQEDAAEYQAQSDVFLTADALHQFRRSPLGYFRRRLGRALECEPWRDGVGDAVRLQILQGREAFERDYASRRKRSPGPLTRLFSKARATRAAPLLSEDNTRTVAQINSAVLRHTVARDLLAEGIAESVVRGELAGQPCQARLDWFNPDTQRGIVQLELVHDLNLFEFLVGHGGHAHKAAFSRALVAVNCGCLFPVHIIAVERAEPFRAGVWEIAASVLDATQRENEETVREMERSHKAHTWPTGFEAMRTIDRI